MSIFLRSTKSVDRSNTAPAQEQVLADLFSRFLNSSTQLQSSYEDLKRETEELRVRIKAKDAEIAQATKLATLGETAAALAHEIRNPLGAIKLFSSLIRDELHDRPDGLKYLQHVEQSIAQLDATISNILQFSKQGPVALGPINLSALLRERVDSFQLSHPNLELSLDVDSDYFVNGIEQSLRQVFNNLLMNAAQASNDKGSVKIALHKTSSGAIELRIHDSGPGIPEAIIGTLFDPFTTTKTEGIGLGLAIVKRLLEQQGADVKAFNQNGAVFTITFPALGASNNGESRDQAVNWA